MSATSRAVTSLPTTPGQTIGPFFGVGLPYDGGAELVPPDLVQAGSPGSVRLRGRVLDGAGDPVPDALVELWQADPAGRVVSATGSLRRDRDTFTGFGRCATDPDGRWCFTTLEPGPTTPGGAAFFALTVFARGLLDRLFTRAYLPGTPPDADALLAGLDDERRRTLLAVRDEDDLRFDVRLQGEQETVFLDLGPSRSARGRAL